jgi:short-subunit dehydrogenase
MTRGSSTSGHFLHSYGPRALITGAAQGIGAGFARALAAQGFSLTLTDIDGAKLTATADVLRSEVGIEVETVVVDLGTRAGIQAIRERVELSDPGLLICNHLKGSPSARFLDGDVADHRSALDVNVAAYVELTHLMGRHLRDRGRGGIILMSSMTGILGSPGVAMYGASKSFVLALGSALSYDLRATGVDLLTLVPSSVNTETYRAVLHERAGAFPSMSVDEFVNVSLGALGKRSVLVPGRRNAATAQLLARVLPRKTAMNLMGKSLERITGL